MQLQPIIPPATPASQASLKRKAPTPGPSAEKQVWSTIAGTLSELHDGLSHFTDVIAAVGPGFTVGLDATPIRKNKAIQHMEKFEVDLDNSQKLDLMDLFTSDVAKADAYLAIEGEGLRKEWVARRLREAL